MYACDSPTKARVWERGRRMYFSLTCTFTHVKRKRADKGARWRGEGRMSIALHWWWDGGVNVGGERSHTHKWSWNQTRHLIFSNACHSTDKRHFLWTGFTHYAKDDHDPEYIRTTSSKLFCVNVKLILLLFYLSSPLDTCFQPTNYSCCTVGGRRKEELQLLFWFAHSLCLIFSMHATSQ